MSRVAYPFLTLGQNALKISPWILCEESGDVIVGDWLADWDMARDLKLKREISIDFELAADQLELPVADLVLDARIRFGTGPGSMPRLSFGGSGKRLTADVSEVSFEQTIEGRNLSNRLLMETHVLLVEPRAGANTLSPRYPAARLWSDRHDLRLEGEEPRFPMEITSFSERFSGQALEGAPWFLHWTPGDLTRDFGTAVRLFLNSDREDFAEWFQEGDRSAVQVVLADTMVQIIGALLDRPDTDLEGDLEEGSIVCQARKWIELAFPGKDINAVRAMRELRPSFYHAGLLAAADVVQDEAE